MAGKSISLCQGKGSLAHNNRTFHPKNVDSLRTPDNITFIKIPINKVYEDLFGAAVERYNAKQKRSDRKIKTGYFEYQFNHKVSQSVVTSSDKRKSFYEDVVQIGTKDDTGVGMPDAKIAAECLTEYMNGFQERNPNFHVFNAVLHMDEATPHLHIDYVPVGHYTRGIDTQNGIAQALKEMGYGYGKDAIARWRQSEYEVLRSICIAHNIEISAPEKSRGSKTVEAYKEEKRLEEKLAPLMAFEKIADGTEIPYKKALSKGNVVISKADLEKISEEKKAAAVQVEMARQETERYKEREQQLDKRSSDLDSREEKIDEKEKDTEHRNRQAQNAEYAAESAKLKFENLYAEQQDINSILDNTRCERDRYREKYEQEQEACRRADETIGRYSESDSKLRQLVRDKDEVIDKLNDDIQVLVSKNIEKGDTITKIEKDADDWHKLCNYACEVGTYACNKLGIDFDDCLDMIIKDCPLPVIFGDVKKKTISR